MDINQFKRERDEALLSLDKEKILRFCEKYQVPMPHNDFHFGLAFINQYICSKPPRLNKKNFQRIG